MNLEDCKMCREREYGTGPVPGCGNINALVCLLGRNPGVSEDPVGRPFVGKAGGKLNEGLWKAKLPRAVCWIDNTSKCMTPTNIKPTQQCLRVCSETWLKPTLCSMQQLKLIVTLGNQALHYFERGITVGEYHGLVLPAAEAKVGRKGISIFISYHPSAALRSTLMNRHFMDDMTKLYHYLRKQNLVSDEVSVE